MGRHSDEYKNKMKEIRTDAGNREASDDIVSNYLEAVFKLERVLQEENWGKIADSEEYSDMMKAVNSGKEKLFELRKEHDIEFQSIASNLSDVFQKAAVLQDLAEEKNLNITEPFNVLDAVGEDIRYGREEPLQAYNLKKEINSRMLDTDLLKDIADTKEKYNAIGDIMADVLYNESGYMINGTERKLSNKKELSVFADEHLGKPFYELGRHPGQHFKVYALANGITPAQMMELVDDPNSQGSLDVKDRLKELSHQFVDMCATEDMDAVADMYTKFADVVKDNSEDIWSCSRSIYNIQKNMGLITILGGHQSYITQTLKYGSTRDKSEVTDKLVENIDKKLEKNGTGFDFVGMDTTLSLSEDIYQHNYNQTATVLETAGNTGKLVQAADLVAMAVKFKDINQRVDTTKPIDVMKEGNKVLDSRNAVIGLRIQMASNKKLSDYSDIIPEFYLKEGESIPKGLYKEVMYDVTDESELILSTPQEVAKRAEEKMRQEEAEKRIANFHEQKKPEYEKMRAANKSESSLDTIEEEVLIDPKDYPVREPIISDYPPMPQPFAGEAPDNMDTEVKFMVDQMNDIVYEAKKTMWMYKCLSQFLFEGTTYAPDPDEPDVLVTVQGEKECSKLFKKFQDRPFFELQRPSVMGSHLQAFCMNEGINSEELMEMFNNPNSEKAKATRVKAEEARKKLFEAGCCNDEDAAFDRTVQFYDKYGAKMLEDQQKFLDAGDYSGKAQLLYEREYMNATSLLKQTLRIEDDPNSVGSRITAAAEKKFADRGQNVKLTDGLFNFQGRTEACFLHMSLYTKYLSYDNPADIRRGPYGDIPYYEQLFTKDVKEVGTDAVQFCNNAIRPEGYENGIRDLNKNGMLSELNFTDDMYIAAREIGGGIASADALKAHIGELKEAMGNPKEFMGEWMKELKKYDSGLLKLRGSTAFKDMRTAIDKLDSTLAGMSDNPNQEEYRELGDCFADVYNCSVEYLKGKTNVDINADTNGGHRKNIADKFSKFANAGKAFCHESAKLMDKEADIREIKNEIASKNKKNDTAQLDDKFAALFADGAEAISKLDMDLDAHTLGEEEKNTLCATAVAAMIMHMEVQENGEISGPVSDAFRKKGRENLIDTYSKMPFVKEYAKNPDKISVNNIRKDMAKMAVNATKTVSEDKAAMRDKEVQKEQKQAAK